jgi:type IV secretion system protein VirB3
MTQVAQPIDDGEMLVVAMTRPTMLGGFTLLSIGLSCYVPVMIALLCRSLWALTCMPVFLGASYLICLKDIYLFDIAHCAMHLKACRNQPLWGCRRYAPR